MKPIPFPQLVNWVQSEYSNQGTVFAIPKENFFKPASCDVQIFVKKIGTPIGPSAGPCTQLAQNILACYLAGARYFELKTVQTMDGEELRKAISKPSINAADVGYNVEWTTELTVKQAMEEYIKAWFLCHIFAVEFDICEECDFIFNMSVGYTLDGIKSQKIDSFIEGLRNAKNTEIWQQCYDYLSANLSSFSKFTKSDLDGISTEISKGITISTFYNCPSGEIEKITAWLLGEKSLNTFIKLNPTLLGFETTRSLLDEMGYNDISFSDYHFKNDLQFSEAARILRNLKALAYRLRLGFGVKLTNTFPVDVKHKELPGQEMFMSGRALFPLSLFTAKKIADVFHSDLMISYSGGADFFNLKALLETGIRPITMTTNILKPGGLARLTQLAQEASHVAQASLFAADVDTKALNNLCESTVKNSRYRADIRRSSSRKIPGSLPLFDCSLKKLAPCKTACPLNIEIPNFLTAAANKDYISAFKIIARENALPSVVSALCGQNCKTKCIRLDYDDPLQITRMESLTAEQAQNEFISSLSVPPEKTDISTAVIGAGTAGIATAIFLRRNGVPVTVYEKRSSPFGMARYAIPSSRISDEQINRDYMLAIKTGVDFVFNAPESLSIAELKKKHKFVVLATGAWAQLPELVKQGQENILDGLSFLQEAKETNCAISLGKKVAVVGTGDLAFDCERTAQLCKGVDSVAIINNYTKESLSAVRFNTVINAAGQKVDTSLFSNNNIILENNLPKTYAALESSLPDVYIAGSCRTAVFSAENSVSDAKTVAAGILQKLKIEPDFSFAGSEEDTPPAKTARKGAKTNVKNAHCENDAMESLYLKKGLICEAKDDFTEAQRCLSCNTECKVCVDVCPNRANVSVALKTTGKKTQSRQIVHIDSICSECGNCAVFCPYSGRPYKDKPTLFYSEEDFNESENAGFLKTDDNTFTVILPDQKIVKYRIGGKNLPREWIYLLDAVAERYGYLF